MMPGFPQYLHVLRCKMRYGQHRHESRQKNRRIYPSLKSPVISRTICNPPSHHRGPLRWLSCWSGTSRRQSLAVPSERPPWQIREVPGVSTSLEFAAWSSGWIRSPLPRCVTMAVWVGTIR